MAEYAPSRSSISSPSLALAHDLGELKVLWQERFKRRAEGGWWALSGFSLQIIAALETFLKHELIEKKPRVYMDIEGISDFLINGNALHLVQSKRHLTKNTLASSFAEAYDIASLCSEDLSSKINFQIIAVHKDQNTSLNDEIARLGLKGRNVVDEQLIIRTMGMFHAEEPIKILPDPTAALKLLLWNSGVKNPVETMNKAVGRIISAFDGSRRELVQSSLLDALDDILRTTSGDHHSPGKLYLPGDLSISPQAGPREILGDSRPRVIDLKLGRFLPRERPLNAAVGAALQWQRSLSAIVAEQRPRLPVFCIRGRAGDGKSVLLLQLASNLLEQRKLTSITHLINFAELSEWLASRPLAEVNDSTPDIELGLIDDFPNAAEADDWDELVKVSFAHGSPATALLTCGITEDANAQDYHALRLNFFDLPAPTSDEHEFFRQQYNPNGRSAFQSGATLAATLVNISKGEINTNTSLSSRLRHDLEQHGLWPDVRSVVAANILGMAGMLPPHLSATMATFKFKRDGLIIRPIEKDCGFELGHAEILRPLYRDWCDLEGQSHRATWGHDLGIGIATALKEGQPRLARSLLGRMLRMVQSRWLRRRYKNREQAERYAAELLGASFISAQTETDDTKLAPVMRQWLAAAKIREISFPEDLEARATALLDAPEVELSDKADIAIAIATSRKLKTDDHRKIAFELIEATVDQPIIVENLARLASHSNKQEILSLLDRWLIRHQKSFKITPVLIAALRRTGQNQNIYRDIGFRFIELHAKEPETSDLIKALLLHPPTDSQLPCIDRWLSRTADQDALAWVYGELLKSLNKQRYLHRATSWLQNHYQQKNTHELLNRLIVLQPAIDLEQLVDRWIDAHRRDPDLLTVTGMMLSQLRFRRRALPLALQLLAERPQDGGTRFVYAKARPLVGSMSEQDISELTRQLSREQRASLKKLRDSRRPPSRPLPSPRARQP